MTLRTIAGALRRRVGPGLQQVAHASGIMRLQARAQGPAAIVLMYHSVADAPERDWIDPANHVPPSVFAEQIAFLARHRRVVSLEALLNDLRSGAPIEPGTVAVTFDDGYLDNLTVAAPILSQWGVPATLFLPTGYIDRGETQWIDQAYSAFRHRTRGVLRWSDAAGDIHELHRGESVGGAYEAVCADLLSAGADRRRTLLEHLVAELAPTATPPRLTMNWDDVRTLVREHPAITLGGHTLEHIDLTSVSLAEAVRQVSECRRVIRAQTGSAAACFSFCYGRDEAAVADAVGESGVVAAFGGSERDPLIRHGSDLLRLPRVAVPPEMDSFDLLTSTANTRFWRWLGA